MITYRFCCQKDYLAVVKFMEFIDRLFPIPLSEKTSIEDYARKLMDHGYLYVAEDAGTIVGLFGFYANNFEEQKAYFSVLGVDNTYQRQGIAQRLLMDSMLKCKELGMKTCCLFTHKSNRSAIRMYEKLGFSESMVSERPDDIMYVKAL